MHALPPHPAEANMHLNLVTSSSWRGRPLLTRAETAQIFGRSQSWVDDRLVRRALDSVRHTNGRRFVTTASVIRLLYEFSENRPHRAALAKTKRPQLRLVIDNT